MNRKQFLLALVFVALFSFLGGIVGGAISGGGIIIAAKDLLDDSSRDNPYKINYLKSEHIEASTITTSSVNLKNKRGDLIGLFASGVSGNPNFILYTNEKALFQKAFSISITNNAEPIMTFHDKDGDSRISIRVFLREPYMTMLYEEELRLSLGTNRIIETTTGNVTTMKGSICTYDNKGNLTSKMP